MSEHTSTFTAQHLLLPSCWGRVLVTQLCFNTQYSEQEYTLPHSRAEVGLSCLLSPSSDPNVLFHLAF